MKKMNTDHVVMMLIAGLAVFGLSLLLTWPFMWIWNYAVCEAVTITKPIDFWVAYFLLWMWLCLIARPSGSPKG